MRESDLRVGDIVSPFFVGGPIGIIIRFDRYWIGKCVVLLGDDLYSVSTFQLELINERG